MIVKILGIIDIILALLFWVSSFFHIIPNTVILAGAIYLLAKGIIFLMSEQIASVLDVIIAVAMILSLSFALPSFLVIILVLLLLQKGVVSLL